MLQVGETYLKKYRVLGLLGKGGMGQVYLAENINVGNNGPLKRFCLLNNGPST